MSDRLRGIMKAALKAWREDRDDLRDMEVVIVDALLAEGVTLPPEKAGPVTSEETVRAYAEGCHSHDERRWTPFADYPGHAVEAVRHGLDAAMPLLARDHGLLTPEEVERRAREWAKEPMGKLKVPDVMNDLIAALTRPAPRVAGDAAPGAA